MRRAERPDFLESVANHPRVRPWIGGEGEFRAGESWTRTVAVEWPEGGVVFVGEAPGIYSGHLVFAPKTRDVLSKVRQAIAYLFSHTDASLLVAQFPPTHWHVRKIVQSLGMTPEGDYYRLTAKDWQEQGNGLG